MRSALTEVLNQFNVPILYLSQVRRFYYDFHKLCSFMTTVLHKTTALMTTAQNKDKKN